MLCGDLTFGDPRLESIKSARRNTHLLRRAVHVSSLSHPGDPNYNVSSLKGHQVNTYSLTLQIFWTRSTT